MFPAYEDPPLGTDSLRGYSDITAARCFSHCPLIGFAGPADNQLRFGNPKGILRLCCARDQETQSI
jgi:hypothetical protein